MSDLPVTKQSASAVAAMLTDNKVNPTQAGGIPFLRFDAKRTGEWLLGAENEVCTDDIISIDVASLQHGQILWHNKKADRRLVPLNQPLPLPQEPIHYTDAKGKPQMDEANEARAFKASFEDGMICSFEGSTFGARKAVDALLAELFTRANAGSSYLFPQVQLCSESYDHPQYGKVYEPVLKPVAWFDENGQQESAKLEKKDAPVVEQEEPPATPEPTRRRRRAA